MLKTKKGAVSIYIVILSALLFTLIGVGFVGLMVSEMSKTIDESLSSSAYDSAMAGVEDAKIAITQYYNCINQSGSSGYNENNVISGNARTCKEIRQFMETASDDCDSVAKILGRVRTDKNGNKINDSQAGGEVIIQATENSTVAKEMSQAYTCVKLDDTLDDYRASISADNSVRIVPIKSSAMKNITGVRISWYSKTDGINYNYINNDGIFRPLTFGKAIPPIISVGLIQTSDRYKLSDFLATSISRCPTGISECTDRGTIMLTPTDYSTGITHISKTALAKANDKTPQNEPYVVRCDSDNTDEEFACSVTIELPAPLRSDYPDSTSTTRDNAFLVMSLPYGDISTDFAVELCTDTGGRCANDNIATFSGVQTRVDSTGRANDIFRRVESRVELSDFYLPVPAYAVQLSDTGNSLIKNFWTTPTCYYIDQNGSARSCPTSGDLPDPE